MFCSGLFCLSIVCSLIGCSSLVGSLPHAMIPISMRLIIGTRIIIPHHPGLPVFFAMLIQMYANVAIVIGPPTYGMRASPNDVVYHPDRPAIFAMR